MKKSEMGAIVTFLGVVRDEGIRGMEVEVYEGLAEGKLEKRVREAQEKFDIKSVEIVQNEI